MSTNLGESLFRVASMIIPAALNNLSTFVNQEPLVGDEGERLEVDDHLTDDAKVGR